MIWELEIRDPGQTRGRRRQLFDLQIAPPASGRVLTLRGCQNTVLLASAAADAKLRVKLGPLIRG